MNNWGASNNSLSSASNTSFDHDKIPKTMALSLLFLISIVGNSLIVWIIYKDIRLRTTINFLVANIAVSDLLSIIFLVPRHIKRIHYDRTWFMSSDFGHALCKLVPFVAVISTAVSLYSCVFIAIDRFYAVAYPLKGGFTRSRLKYIIPGMWILPALIASPYLYHRGLVHSDGITYCVLTSGKGSLYKIHFSVMIAVHIYTPLLITSILYILIVYKLRRHRVPGNQTDLAKRIREQQKRKVLKMSVVIVSLLCVSWLSYSIVAVLRVEGMLDILTFVQRDNLYFTAEFIGYTSFSYNFFIYVIFNDTYRDNVKNIFKKLCCLHCCRRNSDVLVAGRDGQELARGHLLKHCSNRSKTSYV